MIPRPMEVFVVTLNFKGRFFSLLAPFRKKRITSEKDEEALASIISHMAQTGEGTDACLRHGCLPLPVNFHSPIPDLADLEQRRVWDRVSRLEGIEFRPEAQQEFLQNLGRDFGQECIWPGASDGDPYHFYTENFSFSYGCAAALHAILRKYKPRRVIEVGSGNSSVVITGGLARNAEEGSDAEYLIIDPYPRDIIRKGLPRLTQLLEKRVEQVEPEAFLGLEENDILFIDSGHTVRIGSDVNFILLDVLPRLAPGVVIHFHDIGLPYEYPKVYATTPSFRMFWTEQYLLQAFMCFNHDFEILLAMNYLMTDHMDTFRKSFPAYNPEIHRLTSSSFWIRRRTV